MSTRRPVWNGFSFPVLFQQFYNHFRSSFLELASFCLVSSTSRLPSCRFCCSYCLHAAWNCKKHSVRLHQEQWECAVLQTRPSRLWRSESQILVFRCRILFLSSDLEKNCQILFLRLRSRSCFSDPEKNCQILFLSFRFRSCFSDPEKNCQILFLEFRSRS